MAVDSKRNWQLANCKENLFQPRISGTIKFPFPQPYFNQRLFGYSDFFMQGYEYYVIDGVAGGYVKATVTRELLNFIFKYQEKK